MPTNQLVECVMQESTDRAFITAFLLSGDAELAEAAVLESIEALGPDEVSGEELLERTLRAAIQRADLRTRDRKELEPAFSMLPIELQRVLLLPPYPRQCFVLRVLVGLPREGCAEMLETNAYQVDQAACKAMAELADSAVPRTEESLRTGAASNYL